jgi:DNA-binding GntR family transcriptional regulator
MQGCYRSQVPTDQVPAAERAYQTTKTRILIGEMHGGQLLSEVDVAAELGVSRTPVHEAFLRLAAEDLLDLVPRRGAVVAPTPPHEAIDLLEMRLAIEGAAVRRLCRSPHVIEPLCAELSTLTDRQRHEAAEGDMCQFAAADDAFHRLIVEAAGNAIGQRLYASLGDRQRRMMADAVRGATMRVGTLIDEHTHLMEAIRRSDMSAFETLLVAHLEGAYRVVLR